MVTADPYRQNAARRAHMAGPRNTGIIRIGHNSQPTKTWQNLAQEFEALGREVTCLIRQARDVTARSR